MNGQALLSNGLAELRDMLTENLEQRMERAYEAGARYGWNEALNNQKLWWLPVEQTEEFTAWCAMPVVGEMVRQLEQRGAMPAPAPVEAPAVTSSIDTRNLAATAAKFPDVHARTFGGPPPAQQSGFGNINLGAPAHNQNAVLAQRTQPLPQAPSDRFSPEQLAAAARFLASQQQPVYPTQQPPPEQNIVSETLRRFGRT